ncbi:MAG: PH domain-containing protein, partial [Chloroflexi bacterium]|nr:PH domain-containing protein [Chloroflexota bacterium]
GLKINFAVRVNSYRLERRVRFKWLQENEAVYFLARKHPILLIGALTGPVLLAVAGIIGMLVAWYYSLWFPALAAIWYLSLLASVFAAGWGIWNGIDWGNDYYIVTDRRVVWVEKVVGIYESRQETPLSAVQRVNVEMDLSGRTLDYGDLIIQTIVGSTLTLRNVDHPYQAAALIDQYWKRSKDTSHKMEEEEMNKALRARLLDGQKQPAEIKGIVAKPPEKKSPYEDQRGLANLFRLRFEHLTTVTYRKHIFVLFEQTWIPGLILLILLGILVSEILSPSATFASFFKADTGLLSLLWAILCMAVLLWWIYEYVDWSNDIFQVTPDQILDIDKTPLGQVTSDIASLENILSIEYKRIGILELLFNFGTVYITIGGGKEMTFENVYNPSAVQEDIERRRLERITKKEQDTISWVGGTAGGRLRPAHRGGVSRG